jgi:hypothetical protein
MVDELASNKKVSYFSHSFNNPKKIIHETEKIVDKTLKWAEQNNLKIQPMGKSNQG